ncbi:MAG TPA: mycofactocin biosynthesis peptidyl-dipeptidase MftE [Solirubrobacterales bacterium]|nr:mycofactocin biosynthesis peptidyl-dipeptidase MftE [Solirubrobacterales bacterium]
MSGVRPTAMGRAGSGGAEDVDEAGRRPAGPGLTAATSPEVGALVAAGPTTLLVPLGATEQHGPHLPLGTDSTIAVALAEAAAAEVEGAVVAPVLPYGSSGEHQDFAGTLSIGAAATELVLVELGRSATETFDRLLFVSAHGGNAAPLAAAVQILRAEGRDARAWSPNLRGDAHAGHTETSLLLALDDPIHPTGGRPEPTPTNRGRPEPCIAALRSTALERALLRSTAPEGAPVGSDAVRGAAVEVSEGRGAPERSTVVRGELAEVGNTAPLAEIIGALRGGGVRAVSPNGVLGDPTGASADAGRKLLAAAVADLRTTVRAWDAEPNARGARTGVGGTGSGSDG